MKSMKLGNIEVINLKDMGRMSFNRGRKIIKTQYGGKPWRFPSLNELRYLATLYDIGIGDFLSEKSISTSYWSNQGWAFSGNNAYVYNIKSKNLMSSSTSSAVGYLIIVRSI